jgi:hypothetical protein
VLRKLFSEVAEPGHLNESGLVEILDWAGDTLNRVDRRCGTGAFLVEVLNRIAQTLREKGEEALLAHEIKRAAQFVNT